MSVDKVTLLHLAHGRYKSGGNIAGHFWYAVALCRFELGELDEVIPDLRLDMDAPLAPPNLGATS